MKKLIAVLLAMLLVLVNVAALASGELPATPETGDLEPAGEKAATTPSIPKVYTTTGGTVYPTETLKFTVERAKETYPWITVGNSDNEFDVDGTTDEYTIPVNVPSIAEYQEAGFGAGMYHYTVKETGPEDPSQAVTYDDTVFNVDVYIAYENGELVQSVVIYTGDPQTEVESIATKESELQNTYEVGGLEVGKVIDGSLADPNKTFTLVITLTSDNTIASDLTIEGNITGSVGKGEKEYTFTAILTGGQSVTITNIPAGVGYTVEETGIDVIDGSTDNTQIDQANNLNAYAVAYTNESGTIGASQTIAATVTNTKEITIPTGISMDFVPYMVIIALAGIALVALRIRRREEA